MKGKQWYQKIAPVLWRGSYAKWHRFFWNQFLVQNETVFYSLSESGFWNVCHQRKLETGAKITDFAHDCSHNSAEQIFKMLRNKRVLILLNAVECYLD